MHVQLIDILTSVFYGILLMYVYPRVVFSYFLKNKTLLYKILFCFAAMIVSLNVFVIGIFFFSDNLQGFYFIIVFYSIFIASLLWKLLIGIKTYKSHIFYEIKEWFFDYIRNIKSSFSFSWILIVVALFLCMWTSVQYISVNHYFNFSDMYAHAYWLADMEDGKIFSDGIYPFGMHCCVYAATVAFGVYLPTFYLYFTFIQNFVIFLGVYSLSKSLFKSKYVATLPLLLFGILYYAQIYGPTSEQLSRTGINRFLVCLPQEFCMFAFFAGMACLIQYFKIHWNRKLDDGSDEQDARISVLSHNGYCYLLLYALCVAATITTHFYITFYLFIGTGIIFLVYVFKTKWKYIWPFLIAGFAGVIVAVCPYALYFTKFPKFEESLRWGIKVILGTDVSYLSTVMTDEDKALLNSASSNSSNGTSDSTNNVEAIETNVDGSGFNLFSWLGEVYNNTIAVLFGKSVTPVFVVLFIVAFVITLVIVIYAIRNYKRRNGTALGSVGFLDRLEFHVDRNNMVCAALSYLAITVVLLLFYVLYASPVLGLPRLVESYRFIIPMYLLFTFCLIFPIDAISRIARVYKKPSQD